MIGLTGLDLIRAQPAGETGLPELPGSAVQMSLGDGEPGTKSIWLGQQRLGRL